MLSHINIERCRPVNAEEIIRRNERLCVISSALRAVFLGTAIMTTYYLAHGLTQAQIFVLQTILAVMSVSSDVPFGYLADRIGVRRVMILGSSIMFGQGVYFAFCRTFWQFAIALVATGLYIAALENTADGLMTQSLQLLKDEDEQAARYQRYLIKTRRTSNMAYAATSLGSGGVIWLGGISMPFYLQPVIWALVVVVSWKMIDPPVKERAQHANFQMLIKSLRIMLVDTRSIRYMILLYSAFRLYQMLCFWVLQPRMALAGVPKEAYGIMYFVWALMVASMAGALRNMRAESSPWLWVRIIAVCVIGAYLAGMTTSIWGFLALMMGMILISVIVERLFSEYMHRILPEDGVMRNTELSIGSTIPTLVYALVAPFFGMLVDGTSLGTSFLVLSAGCLLTAGVSFVLFQRSVGRY